MSDRPASAKHPARPDAHDAHFFFDLGSPFAYLVAERVNHTLGVVPEWQPVLMPQADVDRAEVERLASEQGLMPIRWPEGWPGDTRTAMLAATFAKQTGRAVAFSLAAFRQAFAAGRDLSQTDNVLIAAAACELHPNALLKALEMRSVIERLEAATEEARSLGVHEVPALSTGGDVVSGVRLLHRVQSG